MQGLCIDLESGAEEAKATSVLGFGPNWKYCKGFYGSIRPKGSQKFQMLIKITKIHA